MSNDIIQLEVKLRHAVERIGYLERMREHTDAELARIRAALWQQVDDDIPPVCALCDGMKPQHTLTCPAYRSEIEAPAIPEWFWL